MKNEFREAAIYGCFIAPCVFSFTFLIDNQASPLLGVIVGSIAYVLFRKRYEN